MNKQHDALTVALTGQLSLVLIVAAVLALAASLFLLRRYRRVVIKSMQRRGRSEIATPTGFMPPEEPHKLPETPATFNVIDTAALGTAVVKSSLLYR